MRLFIMVLVSLSLTMHAVAETHEQRILQNTLNRYIAPAYLRLEESTHNLAGRITSLCSQPSAESLSVARNTFYATVQAWSFIEWFRIGPVIRENRVERMFFFPDRKSTGLRQIQAILAQQNEAVLDVEQLQKMSVALQGIGTLDFLLFGKGADILEQGKTFRCQFAKSVGENLEEIADNLNHAWQQDEQLKHDWEMPSNTSSFFRTYNEAMNMIIGVLVHGLESIRDTRINVFLRTEPSRDRPKSAALWRSKATITSIIANLEGLERLFTQSHIEAILPKETRYLGDTIRFEFEQSIKTAKMLDVPVSKLLNDFDQREKLEYLKLTINFLIDRLNDEFSPAASLSAGFSFGDGD